MTDSVVLHVDPSCPFAWISSRFFAELESMGKVDLELRLQSLSVVNEHRDINDWYRSFNDAAWAPARVMLAVARAHGADAARRFYEAFGTLFHVGTDTSDDADRVELASRALADADLPGELIDAARDESLDDELRSSTQAVVDEVGLDVGVPVVRIEGRLASGPTLTRIPRGEEAAAAYDAVRVLSTLDGFMNLERARDGALHTS